MKKVLFLASLKNVEWFGKTWRPASELIPEWYKKKSPYTENENSFGLKEYGPNLTVKRCIPFLDAMSHGYVIELQEDISISTLSASTPPMARWRSGNSVVTSHVESQTSGMPIPSGMSKFILKWENNWVIKTPPGYSTFFAHPVNRFDLPFITISGVVDTDKYPLPVTFPFFILENFNGIIPKGTPIVQIFFVKNESWKAESRKFSEKNMTVAWNLFLSHLHAAYKKMWWQKKHFK